MSQSECEDVIVGKGLIPSNRLLCVDRSGRSVESGRGSMLPLQVVAAPDASVPKHDQVPAAFAVNWKVPPMVHRGGTDGVMTTWPEPGGPGGGS